MKYVLSVTLLASTLMLFGFDIQSVDLTKAGKAKSVLLYTVAEDGKKIYKDIGKTINALQNQPIEPMNVVIIYPIDSNISKNTSPSITNKEEDKSRAEEDITGAFTEINLNKQSETESINQDNHHIKLNKKANKAKPIDLEKQ